MQTKVEKLLRATLGERVKVEDTGFGIEVQYPSMKASASVEMVGACSKFKCFKIQVIGGNELTFKLAGKIHRAFAKAAYIAFVIMADEVKNLQQAFLKLAMAEKDTTPSSLPPKTAAHPLYQLQEPKNWSKLTGSLLARIKAIKLRGVQWMKSICDPSPNWVNNSS